jgi:hypothetical protein
MKRFERPAGNASLRSSVDILRTKCGAFSSQREICWIRPINEKSQSLRSACTLNRPLSEACAGPHDTLYTLGRILDWLFSHAYELLRRYALPLAMLSALSACTSQRLYTNTIILKNSCGAPITVTVENFSNLDLPGQTYDIPAEKNLSIGSYISYGEEVAQQIPPTFSLVIKQSTKQLKLGARELLAEVALSQYLPGQTHRRWIISTPRLCPALTVQEPASV